MGQEVAIQGAQQRPRNPNAGQTGSGAAKGGRDPNRSHPGSTHSDREPGNARGRAHSGEDHDYTEKHLAISPHGKKKATELSKEPREGGRKHLSQPRETSQLENQSDKKTLNQSSQQGQSVLAVGSQNLHRKDHSTNHNLKLINQPVLGRHKSKSILSELSQQVHGSGLKDKLVLNQLESPQIGTNQQHLLK